MHVDKNAARAAIGILALLLMGTTVPAWGQTSEAPAAVPITIDAKDVSVTEVLRTLGKAAGVNIIVGQKVEGTVDAINLHDISVEDALRLIAEAQGLYWYKDASGAYVVTGIEPRLTGGQIPQGGVPGAQPAGTPAAAPEPRIPPVPGAARPSPGGASAQPMAWPGTEPVIPVPPLAPGPSSVTTHEPDRDSLTRTAWVKLSYASAAEVADMLGGRIVGGTTGASLSLPTPASSRRRAFSVSSDMSAEATVFGGFGSNERQQSAWRQWQQPGGYGGGGGGRGRYGGGGVGQYGGGGYGGGGYGGGRGGGYGGRGGGYGGGGGYGAGAMMLLPSEFMEIVAYMPQNALLIRGLPEEIDQLKETIQWLDQPAQQVEISCKFVSINVNDTKSFGIDWQTSNGQLEFWNLGFAPADAVNNVVRFARGAFQAELRAAVSSGRATVLAEPIVTTQNNLPAEINFYTEIPYFIAVVTYNEFGNREVDFETDYAYIDNMLSVTPRINADDSVTMEIYPEIDQQVGTVEGPNGERIPITSNWYIYVPQVTVADGETLVIGGIISKSQDEQTRKTPLLSEIPLIGNLFQSKRRTISNSETLIFVTPRIVRPIPRE